MTDTKRRFCHKLILSPFFAVFRINPGCCNKHPSQAIDALMLRKGMVVQPLLNGCKKRVKIVVFGLNLLTLQLLAI